MKEYVDRMKELQNDICYITGENIVVFSSSLFFEDLRKMGLELLYMVYRVDECAVPQLKKFDTKGFCLFSPEFHTEGGLDLGDKMRRTRLTVQRCVRSVDDVDGEGIRR